MSFLTLLVVCGGIFAVLWLLSHIHKLTIQEATSISFKYLGRFAYCAMEFTDHHFDSRGFICDGTGPNSYGSCWCIWRFGGWVFYIYPLVQPAKYSDYNDLDGFGDGVHVSLGDRTSEPIVSTQNTKAPENVGLKVQFVSAMRVVNPYLYLFRSPRDVKKQAVDREDGALRGWIRSGNQEHAQSARGNGAQMWSELVDPAGLNCKPVFDKIRNDWGLEILENSIIVKEVDYSDSDYKAALEATSKEKLLASAEAAKLGGPLKIMMDQWVADEAKRLGLSCKEAVKVLKESGAYDRKEAAFEILRAQGLAGNNFTRDERVIDITSGGKAITDPDFKGVATIVGAIAAAVSQGKGGKQGNKGDRRGDSGGSRGKKVKQMTNQELSREAFAE